MNKRKGIVAAVVAAIVWMAQTAPLPVGLSWEEPAPGLDYGRIYYYVPPRLDLAKKPGLLVFLHGGGAETRDQPAKYLNPTNGWLRPHVDDAPFVVAAPTAPHARGDHWRWGHADAADEVLAVIEAVAARMPIDRDRVILGGQSMGGFGAYHLGPVLADRLAGVWAAAGGWYTCDFRALRGTPMFIQHGTFDCAPGYSNEPLPRAQYKTGVSFARAAHELMARDGVEHVFSEYAGGHGLVWPAAQESTKRFLAWAAGLRRNPYAPAVTVVTPCGSEKPEFATKRRSRWLEVVRTVPGTVALDTIDLSDYESARTMAEFEAQTYSLRKKRLAGFRLEAFNRGNNRFEVRAENVTAFRIHLGRPMGDLARPFAVDAGALGTKTLRAVPDADGGEYEAVLDFVADVRPAKAAQVVCVRPEATRDALVNPGMGLVYCPCDGNLWKYGAATRPSETLDWFPGMGVVWVRLPWRDLVGADGRTRWDVIDTFARVWSAKGRQFAVSVFGADMPRKMKDALEARYARDPALAFLSTDDGLGNPDVFAPEICSRTFLPLNWKEDEILGEIEKRRPLYLAVRGFPELCQRNNEELFLAAARRIGYRFELREVRYPDVITSGTPFQVETTWANVGVRKPERPAVVAFSLVDAEGRTVWTCAAETADLRTLEPKTGGVESPQSFTSSCVFGISCELPKAGDAAADVAKSLYHVGEDRRLTTVDPGVYTLAVSVGRANGAPEIALPLAGGKGRVYPLGKIEVRGL